MDSRSSLVLSWKQLNDSTRGHGCRLSRPGQPYYRRKHWHNVGGVVDGTVLQGAAFFDQYFEGVEECPGEYFPGLRDGCRTFNYPHTEDFFGGRLALRLDGEGLWIGVQSPPAVPRFPSLGAAGPTERFRWSRPEEASLDALTELAPQVHAFIKRCSMVLETKSREESQRRARAARMVADPQGEGHRW